MSTSDPVERAGEPAGERAGEPLSLERLLATYTAWSSADVVGTARRRAHDAGDAERASALEAMASQAPSPLKALSAAHEVTSLLAGWRWHTVRAAREAGASWDDIGAATVPTPPLLAPSSATGSARRASRPLPPGSSFAMSSATATPPDPTPCITPEPRTTRSTTPMTGLTTPSTDSTRRAAP